MATKQQLESRNLTTSKALQSALEINEQLQEQLDIQNSNKNHDFVQVSRDPGLGNMLILAKNPTAMQVYLIMVATANYSSNAVVMDKQEVSKLLNVTTRTIERAIKSLCEMGFIAIIKRSENKFYVLNPEIIWAAKNNQRKYCQFRSVAVPTSIQNDFNAANDKFRELRKRSVRADI